MTMHAVLAWFGLRAVPHFHDVRVHDALSDDTAVISSFRSVARQSQAVSRTMTHDPGDTGRITKGVDDMRNLMAEVARRADR